MKQLNGMKLLTGTVLLVALFVLVALTACVPAQKKPDSIDPIRNAREFGRAIGCVMAPHTCPPSDTQKRQEEQKFLKEFEKIDRESSQSTAK